MRYPSERYGWLCFTRQRKPRGVRSRSGECLDSRRRPELYETTTGTMTSIIGVAATNVMNLTKAMLRTVRVVVVVVVFTKPKPVQGRCCRHLWSVVWGSIVASAGHCGQPVSIAEFRCSRYAGIARVVHYGEHGLGGTSGF